jgi:hypothetical protein
MSQSLVRRSRRPIQRSSFAVAARPDGTVEAGIFGISEPVAVGIGLLVVGAICYELGRADGRAARRRLNA